MNCGCRNSETCKCAPHLDIGELRDKVRELKAQKGTLLELADSITQEIDSKMAKLREAKHHRLQVDPDPELRLHFSNSHNGPSSDLNDEQFRVANEKLEMQILMQDIRAALFTLEKEVRWREAVATKSKKTTAKMSKVTGNGQDGSPLIWHAIDDVKDRLKEEINRSVASHKLRADAVEAEKRETNQLLQDASSYRKQLSQLLRERDHIVGVTDSVEQQYRSERYRQQLIREEFLSQREALRRFHGGFGFQTEAFLKETNGDPSASLSLQRAAAAMRPWMLPIEDSSATRKQSNWLTSEVLAQHLASVQSDLIQPNEPTLKPGLGSLEIADAFRFYEEDTAEERLADTVDASEPESRSNDAQGHRPSVSTDVRLDLKTFCVLFDRLILVYNT